MRDGACRGRAVNTLQGRYDDVVYTLLLLERCTNAVASPFGVNEALCKHDKTMP